MKPVTNADLDAVVYFNPTVCSAKPTKSKTPRIAPFAIASFEITRNLRKNTTANKIDATVKRMEMYTKGDAFSKTNFVRTNVLPQTTVMESKYNSARVRRVICISSNNDYSIGGYEANSFPH
jgi:hypothetical protein